MGRQVLLGALQHADGREMKGLCGRHFRVTRSRGEVQSACRGRGTDLRLVLPRLPLSTELTTLHKQQHDLTF